MATSARSRATTLYFIRRHYIDLDVGTGEGFAA
jgi:hypothetical protein